MKRYSSRLDASCRVQVLSVLLLLVLVGGCTKTGTNHAASRSRFAAPAPPPESGTDWKAVTAALGGGAKSGGTKIASVAKRGAGSMMAMATGRGAAEADVLKGSFVNQSPMSQGSGGFAWPSNGKISRGFNVCTRHHGIDILAPTGTPVYAARAGRVICTGDKLSGYGKVVILEHNPDLASVYGHNSKVVVREGDHVQAGQKIAEVGETGRATAPHCHFEIRCSGKAVDPAPFLPCPTI